MASESKVHWQVMDCSLVAPMEDHDLIGCLGFYFVQPAMTFSGSSLFEFGRLYSVVPALC